MSNILSNRFFQGTAAIAVIAISIFTYRHYAGETVVSDSEVTTTAAAPEGKIEAGDIQLSEDNKVENAVNKAAATDNINTAAEETTNNNQ